jgi:hypothetical protein
VVIYKQGTLEVERGQQCEDLYEKQCEDKCDIRSWYIVKAGFVDGGHVMEFHLRNLSPLWWSIEWLEQDPIYFAGPDLSDSERGPVLGSQEQTPDCHKREECQLLHMLFSRGLCSMQLFNYLVTTTLTESYKHQCI